MHRLKSLFILLALFATTSSTLFAAPFTPDDQQILAILPTDSPPPRYSTASDFVSKNANTSPEQTRQLLERAYLQSDPRALGQAQAQLDQSANQNAEILMLRARALQAAHKFDEAKGVLEQILSQNPSDPDALLTLSSLLLVQGEFDEAISYCDGLNDASLRVYQLACVAQINSMTGKLTEAKQTLSGLASLAPGLDAATARWIYLMQADAALRSQDAPLAEEVFAVMDSQTVPTLMARADWLLAQGEYDKVQQLINYTYFFLLYNP